MLWGVGGGAALNTFKFLWNGLEKHKNVVIHLADFHFMKENFNPIQDGMGGGPKLYNLNQDHPSKNAIFLVKSL